MQFNYMGILSLSENDDNIKVLTKNRNLATVPVAGRYRIIDFMLSNFVNSGVKNVGVLTNNSSRSLIDHIGSGKPWDLDRKIGGIFLNFSKNNSKLTDIEALKNNLEHLYRSKEENVIVASSYMLCNIDLKDVAKNHEESGADITVVYKKITNGKTSFRDCDVINISEDSSVIGVGKNIGVEDHLNISTEIFILKRETIINIVFECVKTGYWTNLKDYIYHNLERFSINAHEFKGYLQCINSIDAYYETNMDLLDIKHSRDLFYANGLIYTKVADGAPTKYTCSSKVSNSLIANGCVIEGTVENCVLGRRVLVHKGVHLKNCIIMQNCEIKDGASLNHVIMDKNVLVEANRELLGDPEFPLVIQKKTVF